ncbi:Predicted oxidoreductase [Sphingomonas laterariae]|uniref:Predicted oxidoreductase n=1 Tax=Edaphosphingomonas laterariae TaxID=861865 RepID=A0A239KNA3_9SPHN|nr:aldo/keto reductase [Sphingomonas laterariae]SNT18654.1 Predicted oxidoreductase [Sphingomonas laterariae]
MLDKAKLAHTDLTVSQLCYGTNMFGTAIQQDAADAILDRFVALGGNFLDSARSYGDWIPDAPKGASERTIGDWLKRRGRDGMVIATKGCMVDLRVGDWRNRVTPEDLASDLGESLDHLGIATIDLYWLHADNPEAPVQTIIDALIGHQKAGRIRYFGASNWSPERIAEAQACARSIGHQGFVAVQPYWGLAKPNPEGQAAQGYGQYYEDGFAAVHGDLTMIPYSSQSRGFFAKIEAAGEDGLRGDLKQMYLSDTNRARLAAAQALAKQHGVSTNDIALAYLVNQPLPTLPIVGASSPAQIEEAVAATRIKLSAAELKALDVTA